MYDLSFIKTIRWACTALLCISPVASMAEPPTPEALEFFESKVRPILVENCTKCHGAEKQKSGLRLDTATHFAKGGESGPVFNTKNPTASRLLNVIEYRGKIKMPEDKKLPEAQIEIIRQWVTMGAPWPEEAGETAAEAAPTFSDFISQIRESHWSFKPIHNAPIPTVSTPDWVDSPIDAFILAGLDQAGLKPSPQADKRTLIRRLNYDLTGLPPTKEEVEAFITDERPEAYTELVERLLASPHYGERWGRHWLDVARYADTKGYVFQEDRFYPYSYTYRDYVIRSFNEDLPYDQFIIEQLAADRLELGEDKRPLAALGFLTLGRRFINNVHDITDDRIDVVSRGLLGLTVSCARCHDHKYDPISQGDYYALYGIFRSTQKPGEFPLIEQPDTDDPLYQEFQKILTEKRKELTDYEADQHVKLLNETRSKIRAYLVTAEEAMGNGDVTAVKTLAKESEIRYQVLTPWVTLLNNQLNTPDAIFRPFAWYKALPDENFSEAAKAVTSKIIESTSGDQMVNPLVRKAFESSPASMKEVMERYATLLEDTDSQWRDQLASHAQIIVNTPDAPIPVKLDNTNAEAIRQIIYAKNSPANIARSRLFSISNTPIQQTIRAKRRNVAKHEATHLGRPDRASSIIDSPNPFNPYIFLRGKPGNRGENVPRRFLEVLSQGDPIPYEQGSGRLEMAKAITDPNNPLTARVMVNRVWLHHFGRGLVNTPSDFGLQGDSPSHPELLDFLATYFIEHNWSVKDLHRVMVLSNAYRQSSHIHEAGAEKDIDNTLVWRQTRKRLDFEAMRDSLLTASGEIDLALGGPPVSITKEPSSPRRAVYGLVERQNMAGFIKNFDFASPDTHSPKRYKTIVPQQALFLMNSPFVVERARAIGKRTSSIESLDARIEELFEICYQREPSPDELAELKAFVERDDFMQGPTPPPEAEWRYGYGRYNAETQRVEGYTKLTIFKEGRWQPRDTYPNKEIGYIALTKDGGHPGNTTSHASIRRWVAPRDGRIDISGTFKHGSEHGDGLLGYIVSDKNGLLGDYAVKKSESKTDLNAIEVKQGETIDFVASPGPTTSHDSFSWTMRIKMDRPANSTGQSLQTKWESRKDFAGPPPALPEPLSPWAQFAQVLLLTNEFMYVD